MNRLRLVTMELLALPKAERVKLVEGWEAKRLAEKAKHEAKLEAEKAELRRIHGDWADDPDFFPF